MSDRIKGQEVEVLMVVDGTQQETLTDVSAFEIGLLFEVKEEGYLGQKEMAFDDIYNGARFSLDLHYDTQARRRSTAVALPGLFAKAARHHARSDEHDISRFDRDALCFRTGIE